MSQLRIEYFKDLAKDAESISQNPEVISAIILSDSHNGIRKALLEISENIRQAAEAQNAGAVSVEKFCEIVERNLK